MSVERAFIGDNDAIVTVEMSGAHWWYVRHALIVQIPELELVAQVQAAGILPPDTINYAEWAQHLEHAQTAIYMACQEAPGSVIDPTTEGTGNA